MITVVKGARVSVREFLSIVDDEDLTATWNVSGFWLADVMTAGLVARKQDPIKISGLLALAHAAMDSVEGGHLFEEIFAVFDSRVPTEPGTVAIRFTVDVAKWWAEYGGQDDDEYGYNFDLEYGPNSELGEFEDDEEDWGHDDD